MKQIIYKLYIRNINNYINNSLVKAVKNVLFVIAAADNWLSGIQHIKK